MFTNHNIFRSLVEETQAIMLVFRERQLCYINPMTEMVTGYSIEELKANFCLYNWLDVDLEKANTSLFQEAEIPTKFNKKCWLKYWCKLLDGKLELITAVDNTSYKQQTKKETNPDSYLRLNLVDSNKKNDILMLPSDPNLKEIFGKISNFINAHYHESIKSKDVATKFNYSPAYLTNLIKEQTGIPLNRWIINRRVTEVEHLLLIETDYSIEEVAATVGYSNIGHFYRQFYQYHGTTPKKWRCAEKKKLDDTDGKQPECSRSIILNLRA